MNIIGLPDTAIQEAKERVRAAPRNSDCAFPLWRITVNLAPADLKKKVRPTTYPSRFACCLASGKSISCLPERYSWVNFLWRGLRHTKGMLAMVSVA
jgi:magnesium chelatase family protein